MGRNVSSIEVVDDNTNCDDNNHAASALCGHIQKYGFQDPHFSDITLTYQGKDYFLHKIVLSQSHYFRSLFAGPWKENNQGHIELRIDDPAINPQGFESVIGYLYGFKPVFSVENLASVFASGSFLGLYNLCETAIQFAVQDLNLVTYEQYYALSDMPGIGKLAHTLKEASWRFLCSHACRELLSFLPNLSLQMLCNLLKADELWIRNELDRYKLAKLSLGDWKLARKRCSSTSSTRKTGKTSPRNDKTTLNHKSMESPVECCTNAKGKSSRKNNKSKIIGDTELYNLRRLWEDGSAHQEEKFEEVFDNLFTNGGIIFAHMEVDEILQVKKELENADLPVSIADNSMWHNVLLKNHILKLKNGSSSARNTYDSSSEDDSDSEESSSEEDSESDEGKSNINNKKITNDVCSMDIQTSTGFSWFTEPDIGMQLSGFPPIRFGAEFVFKDKAWSPCVDNEALYGGSALKLCVKHKPGGALVSLIVLPGKIYQFSMRQMKYMAKVYVHTTSGMYSVSGVGIRSPHRSKDKIVSLQLSRQTVVEDNPLRVVAVVQLVDN